MMATSGCSSTATSTDAGTDGSTVNTDGSTDSSTGDGNTTTDGGNEGGACHDDNGQAPYCGPVGEGGDPDAGDAGPEPACGSQCDTASQYFKKGVARAINACLNSKTGGDGGGCTSFTEGCVNDALDKACDDNTAKAFCEPFAKNCTDAGVAGGKTIGQADCEKFVRALNAEGRTAFTTCVTEGDPNHCVTDPTSCYAELKPF
jgi:hypothetical protein